MARVQMLDEAVDTPLYTNDLEKGMNPSIFLGYW